jgi:hypothetical protein
MYLQTVFDILIQSEPDSRWLGGQRLYGKPRTFKLFSIFSSSLNRILAAGRPEAVWKATYLQAV